MWDNSNMVQQETKETNKNFKSVMLVFLSDPLQWNFNKNS